MFKIGGQRVPTRTLLLVFSDLWLVLFGLVLAISFRFLYWRSIHSYLQQANALYRLGIAMLACELALHYHDLYDPEAIRRHTELLVRLLQALGTACLALAILYYLFPEQSLGRGIAVMAAPIIFLLLLGWRLLMGRWGFLLWEPRRVLMLGTGPVGISFVREILARPDLKIKVVGFLDENPENIGKPLVNPGIIGAVADVQEIAAREKIDCIVLSLSERRGNTPVRQLLDLKFAGIAVEEAHSIWEEISGRIRVQHLSPSWLILSEGFRKPRLLVAAKRAVDFVAALVGLIVFSPIMLCAAIAIWLETAGPVLFRQERTGLHRVPFHILKFRSMHLDAEKHGPRWATDGDHRITRVGRVIRKLRFDELPQFINVLRGEMSLVGPRPERPVFCEMLEKEIPLYAQQVKYQYGASVEETRTKLEYDLFYIKHMSILLDLAILFETGKVLLSGRGAK
jgi:sugar transferase (PEP-CTERM system associated)